MCKQTVVTRNQPAVVLARNREREPMVGVAAPDVLALAFTARSGIAMTAAECIIGALSKRGRKSA